MKRQSNGFSLKIVLAFAAVYLIWGTTYLAIKIGIAELPPFLMAAFRYLLASAVLAAFCLLGKQHLLKTRIVGNMLLGAFMLTFGQGVLFWAELHLSSGLTAVLVSTLPMCYLVVDRKNWKSYFRSKLTLFGIILGFGGIVLLFSGALMEGGGSSQLIILASMAVIFSCLCWAWGSIYYKQHAAENSLFADVCWQLLGGSIACIVVSITVDPLQGLELQSVSLKAWGAVAYLAIAGSVVAFSASYYLLSVRPPAVVGTYAYVNPIVAVLLGVFVADEKVTTVQIVGIGVILIAAYLSNRAKLKG